jgi:hypothetical protein
MGEQSGNQPGCISCGEQDSPCHCIRCFLESEDMKAVQHARKKVSEVLYLLEKESEDK